MTVSRAGIKGLNVVMTRQQPSFFLLVLVALAMSSRFFWNFWFRDFSFQNVSFQNFLFQKKWNPFHRR
jgi:hypothetical protein